MIRSICSRNGSIIGLQEFDQPLLIASSRFRITFPIIVQAASSEGLESRVGLSFFRRDQLLGSVRLVRIMCPQVVKSGAQLGKLGHVRGSGCYQPEHVSQAVVGCRAGARKVRSARPRAASMNCGSFIRSSAWSGVLVRSRRTWHDSREGASKVVICGGGEVRFQKV